MQIEVGIRRAASNTDLTASWVNGLLMGLGSPITPLVIRCSTKGRSSFALATVVWIRSWRRSSWAWFRSSDVRCSVTRPSLRWATRWRIDLLLA